jgi:hypothetical protein
VLIAPEGDILNYAIQVEFSATNNIVEYEGWVMGQLLAKQVQKEYDCNNDKMAEYLAEVRRMEKFFDGFEVRYVPRLDNHDADHLAWIASSRAPTPPDIIIEKLAKPSVKPDLMVIDEPEQGLVYDWMSLIKMFLDN